MSYIEHKGRWYIGLCIQHAPYGIYIHVYIKHEGYVWVFVHPYQSGGLCMSVYLRYKSSQIYNLLYTHTHTELLSPVWSQGEVKPLKEPAETKRRAVHHGCRCRAFP